MGDFFAIPVTWYGAPWVKDGTTLTLDSSQFTIVDPPTQQAANAFWDQPDQDAPMVNSRDYAITFPFSQFVGIKRGDAILNSDAACIAKNGTSRYRVKEVSSVEDGAFYRATLEAQK